MLFIIFLVILVVVVMQHKDRKNSVKTINEWLKSIDQIFRSSPRSYIYLWSQVAFIFDPDTETVKVRYLHQRNKDRDIPFSSIIDVATKEHEYQKGNMVFSETSAFKVICSGVEQPLVVSSLLQKRYFSGDLTDDVVSAFRQIALYNQDSSISKTDFSPGYHQQLVEHQVLKSGGYIFSVISLSILMILGCYWDFRDILSPSHVIPDSVESSSYPSIEYSTRLSCGHYTAGVDFPAGKYDISVLSGRGNVSSDNLLSGGVNEIMSKESDDYSISSFHGAHFDEGVTLSVGGTLMIEITSDEASGKPIEGREQDSSGSKILDSGNWIAGEDFPEGTYNIECTNGSGNIYTDNSFDRGINEIISSKPKEGYITQAKNIYIPEGTELTLSGVSVKLIPVN